MKFIILFIVVITSNHQFACGKSNALINEENFLNNKEFMQKALNNKLYLHINNIPGVNTLTRAVESAANIKQSSISIFQGVTDIIDSGFSGGVGSLIDAALLKTGITDKLNSTLIPIFPIGAKDTRIGDLIEQLSVTLGNGARALQNTIADVNQTLENVAEAGQNFVNNGLGKLNVSPDSKCSKSIVQVQQNFTENLVTNAKFCVHKVINTVNGHIRRIDAIQAEINFAIQNAKVRLSLFSDCITAATSILVDFSLITSEFPTCEFAALTKSLMNLTPLFTSSVSCISSFVFAQ